jgi:hypothetical protein
MTQLAQNGVEVSAGVSAKKRVPEFVAPFWLVKTTPFQELANMTLKAEVVSGDANTLIIPYMTNEVAIAKGRELLLYKPQLISCKFPRIDVTVPTPAAGEAPKAKRPKMK